jgi:poly-gamma-glutamate synthesis protein (capsule biosynthesis protein)
MVQVPIMGDMHVATSQEKGTLADKKNKEQMEAANFFASKVITLFLCGDVMTGRGIDQIMPSPSDPVIYESYIRSAYGYVKLAEKVNGIVPKPLDYAYIWGDALAVFERIKPDLRIINLETSVTTSDD